ncbi:MAG: dihydrofolate reductase [Cytophagaceae bacterium]|nr:dihydrofolate reductase [Cytophagaceae bacterium]
MISVIVAAGKNLAIGKDNKLIWHLPNDLKFFKNKTMGHHMIMGRKTYESIGKPLPGRTSVIVTRNKNYKIEGCIVVNSLKEAIETAKKNGESEAFVIGGAELINDSLAVADRIYFTEVKESFEADVFLKAFDRSKWKEVAREEHKADEKHEYDYAFVEFIKSTVHGPQSTEN